MKISRRISLRARLPPLLTNPLSIDVNPARQYIENHLDKRQVNKIQHAFPSTRYWTEADIPVDEVLDDRQRLPLMGRGSAVNLYVGVPYCIKTNPSKCGYCPFPVEEFSGYDALQTYFEHVKREAAFALALIVIDLVHQYTGRASSGSGPTVIGRARQDRPR